MIAFRVIAILSARGLLRVAFSVCATAFTRRAVRTYFGPQCRNSAEWLALATALLLVCAWAVQHAVTDEGHAIAH